MRISKLYTPQSQPNTSNPSTIASWKLNLLCANQRYVFSAHQDVVHVFEVGEASSGLALINLACRDEINNMVLKRITISSLGRAATTASSSSNEDTQTSETMVDFLACVTDKGLVFLYNVSTLDSMALPPVVWRIMVFQRGESISLLLV